MFENQNKIIQDLQEINKNLHINQAWTLFQRHNIDYIVNNKTWFAQYSDYDEFKSDEKIKEYLNNYHSLLGRNNPPYIKAYCEICNRFIIMNSGYDQAYESELYFHCGMNSRMRGMYEYVIKNFKKNKKVYIQESVTPAYSAYEKYFGPDNIVGSEYLGRDRTCGQYYEYDTHRIMHQDCTKLLFNDNTFDLIISQHVFEHVFDVEEAIKQSFRVLKNKGSIVISIPFFYNSENSVMLANETQGG